MSDAVLNHGYSPEQHAPDPVASHGDPVAPGKLAIWLFLASEIMFFIGLLGTYIVLRSGDPKGFEVQGQTLNKWLAGVNTLILITSSLTMALSVDAAQKRDRRKTAAYLAVTILCAFGFLFVKYLEYSDKFHHYTVLTKEGKGTSLKNYIYDGHLVSKTQTVEGNAVMPAGARWVVLTEKAESFEPETPAAVVREEGGNTVIRIDAPGTPEISVASSAIADIEPGKVKDHEWTLDGTRRLVARDEAISVHTYVPHADAKLREEAAPGGAEPAAPKPADADHAHETFVIPIADVNDYTWYGPQKNIFYNCYFALTGVHLLHVVGGIFPMIFLLVHSLRGRLFPAHTEYVGLYWHFVDLVWIFLFPLMYLI